MNTGHKFRAGKEFTAEGRSIKTPSAVTCPQRIEDCLRIGRLVSPHETKLS